MVPVVPSPVAIHGPVEALCKCSTAICHETGQPLEAMFHSQFLTALGTRCHGGVLRRMGHMTLALLFHSLAISSPKLQRMLLLAAAAAAASADASVPPFICQ